MTKRRIIFVGLALFLATTVFVLSAAGSAQNPETPAITRADPATEQLGRLLFWDPILSGNRDTACATCHHPDFAYADGRDLSRGTGAVGLGPARTDVSKGQVPVVKRNSPTILNVAFNGLDDDDDNRRRRRGFDGATQTAQSARASKFWDSRMRSHDTHAHAR